MLTQDDKYRRYAEKVAIFKNLQAHEVEDILHKGKLLFFPKGQTIFHEGQLGANLFVVLNGKVGLYNKTREIAHLQVGDAFGEMAVLNHRPRTATAVALEETKVFTLDEREINSILEKHVSVRLLLNIIHILSERLEHANSQLSKFRKEAGK